MAGGHVLPYSNKGEQMVRYYGYYSNVSRGRRKEAGHGVIHSRLLLPGYGKTGPYAQRRVLGVHIAANTGDTYLRWYPGVDLMTQQLGFHSDVAGASSAVIAALHHRRQRGEGQIIELGQAENVLTDYIQALMDYTTIPNSRSAGTSSLSRRRTAVRTCTPPRRGGSRRRRSG